MSAVAVYGQNGHLFVAKSIGADGSAQVDFDTEYFDEAGESLQPVKFTDEDGNASFAYRYKHPAKDGSGATRYLIGAAYSDPALGGRERIGYYKVHVKPETPKGLQQYLKQQLAGEAGELTHEELVQAAMDDEAAHFRLINSSPIGEDLLVEMQNRAAHVCYEMHENGELPLVASHEDYAPRIAAAMPAITGGSAAVDDEVQQHSGVVANFDIDSSPSAGGHMFPISGEDMFNVHFTPIGVKLKKRKKKATSSSSSSSSSSGAKAAKAKARRLSTTASTASTTNKKKKKSSSSATASSAKERMKEEVTDAATIRGTRRKRTPARRPRGPRPQDAPKPASAVRSLAEEKKALVKGGRTLAKKTGKGIKKAGKKTGSAALTTVAAGVVAGKAVGRGARSAQRSAQQSAQQATEGARKLRKSAGRAASATKAVAGSAGKILGQTAREAVVAAAAAAATAGTQAIVEQSAAAIERRRIRREQERRRLKQQEEEEEVEDDVEDDDEEQDDDDEPIGADENGEGEDPTSVLLNSETGDVVRFDEFGNNVIDQPEETPKADAAETSPDVSEDDDDEEEEEVVTTQALPPKQQTAPMVFVPQQQQQRRARGAPLMYDDLDDTQRMFYRRNWDGTATFFAVVLDEDDDGYVDPQFDPALATFPPEHQLYTPDATTVFNLRGGDGDGDGIPDEYDDDDDNDGIPDYRDTQHGLGGGVARDGIPGYDGVGDFDGDGRTDDVDGFVGTDWRDLHDTHNNRGYYIQANGSEQQDDDKDVIPAHKKEKKRGCGCRSSVIRIKKIGQENEEDDDAEEAFDAADRDGDGIVEFTGGDDDIKRPSRSTGTINPQRVNTTGKALVFGVPAWSQRESRPILLYCPTCPNRPLVVDINSADAKAYISKLMSPLVIEATEELLAHA